MSSGIASRCWSNCLPSYERPVSTTANSANGGIRVEGTIVVGRVISSASREPLCEPFVQGCDARERPGWRTDQTCATTTGSRGDIGQRCEPWSAVDVLSSGGFRVSVVKPKRAFPIKAIYDALTEVVVVDPPTASDRGFALATEDLLPNTWRIAKAHARSEIAVIPLPVGLLTVWPDPKYRTGSEPLNVWPACIACPRERNQSSTLMVGAACSPLRS